MSGDRCHSSCHDSPHDNTHGLQAEPSERRRSPRRDEWVDITNRARSSQDCPSHRVFSWMRSRTARRESVPGTCWARRLLAARLAWRLVETVETVKSRADTTLSTRAKYMTRSAPTSDGFNVIKASSPVASGSTECTETYNTGSRMRSCSSFGTPPSGPRATSRCIAGKRLPCSAGAAKVISAKLASAHLSRRRTIPKR
jgi:hypothetical protein